MKPIVSAALVTLAVLAPNESRAQGRASVSLVGGAEYVHITEDEGVLGRGPGGILGIQLNVSPRTAVEIEVSRVRHVRDLDLHVVATDPQGRLQPLPYVERWEGTATFALGQVSHQFGESRAPVVVWGGGGLMAHGGTTRGPLTLPDYPPTYTAASVDLQTRRGESVTAWVADGGAGVDVKLTERVTVRPFGGLRLTTAGGAGPKYIIRGGARVAFRL